MIICVCSCVYIMCMQACKCVLYALVELCASVVHVDFVCIHVLCFDVCVLMCV